eukprot:COSAG03_NODE_932_length_5271_cov_6.536156_2_plen_90_part_00
MQADFEPTEITPVHTCWRKIFRKSLWVVPVFPWRPEPAVFFQFRTRRLDFRLATVWVVHKLLQLFPAQRHDNMRATHKPKGNSVGEWMP